MHSADNFGNRLEIVLKKIKPKFYKKGFYVGNNLLIKFTFDGIKLFLYKLIWIIVIIVMLLAMLLGGLALTQSSPSTVTSTIIN